MLEIDQFILKLKESLEKDLGAEHSEHVHSLELGSNGLYVYEN
jgi:hypothetical protein